MARRRRAGEMSFRAESPFRHIKHMTAVIRRLAGDVRFDFSVAGEVLHIDVRIFAMPCASMDATK